MADSAPSLVAEAEQEFCSQVHTILFKVYLEREIYNDLLYQRLVSSVVRATGAIYVTGKNLWYYVNEDYSKCRLAVEACYLVLADRYEPRLAAKFEQLIRNVLQNFTANLALGWHQGRFVNL